MAARWGSCRAKASYRYTTIWMPFRRISTSASRRRCPPTSTPALSGASSASNASAATWSAISRPEEHDRRRLQMEQRPLGKTGTTVSALGFGCGTAGGLMNKGEPREQRAIVERAIEAGITYFDTAPNYGDGLSETNLGRVIRDLGVRDQVLISTKAGLLERDMTNPEAALRSIVDGSLRRLGLHSVDLLFLHSRVQPEPDERSISLRGADALADVFDVMRAEGKTA